jgi:hypothetical protein
MPQQSIWIITVVTADLRKVKNILLSLLFRLNTMLQFRMLFSCLLFLCLGISSTYSQTKQFAIIGKVIDSATGMPLVNASAFCPNSTSGTLSDTAGIFKLSLKAGGYDLLVTYTGYVKQSMRISNDLSSGDTLVFALLKEDNSLAEVAVMGSMEVSDGWQRYGNFFIDHFIGSSPNAAECRLLNPEALHFYYYKKRGRLKVLAKDDLLVQNFALGYTIRYQLDSFSYDYNTRISQYTGNPLFSEMDSTADCEARWKARRAHTYLGSRLHFMRALYDASLEEEGFFLEKIDSGNRQNEEPLSVKNIYDSSLYQVDSNEVYINWSGQYRVSFKKVHPEKEYLKEYKLPGDLIYQISLLTVQEPFFIRENGYFYEQYDLINTGYWAWKNLAELLPYDYVYE